IIVAGESFNGTNYDITVVRYNADGSLDTSFGGAGKVTTNFPANGDDKAYRVVFDNASGKTLVAGSTNNGTRNDFALVRYNVDGTLDASFGNGGRIDDVLPGGVDDSISGLAID